MFLDYIFASLFKLINFPALFASTYVINCSNVLYYFVFVFPVNTTVHAQMCLQMVLIKTNKKDPESETRGNKILIESQ